MSDTDYRRISELLDGEIDDSGIAGCIRRIAGDADFRARIDRYVIVRDCLRRSAPANPGVNIADRVNAMLENEPVVLAPRARGGRRRGLERVLRPAAGFAIAASVATVAVLGLRDSQFTGNDGTRPQVANPSGTELAERAPAADSPLPQLQYADARLQTPMAQTASANDRAWLNTYLLRHNEAAGAVGGTGFIPYVHIVTREPNEAIQATDGQEARPIQVNSQPE